MLKLAGITKIKGSRHYSSNLKGAILDVEIKISPISYKSFNLRRMLIVLFLVVEWLGRNGQYAIERIQYVNKPIRWIIYLTIIIMTFCFTGEEQQFIYFQF